MGGANRIVSKEGNGYAVIKALLSPYARGGETTLETLLNLKKSGKLSEEEFKEFLESMRSKI